MSKKDKKKNKDKKVKLNVTELKPCSDVDEGHGVVESLDTLAIETREVSFQTGYIIELRANDGAYTVSINRPGYKKDGVQTPRYTTDFYFPGDALEGIVKVLTKELQKSEKW